METQKFSHHQNQYEITKMSNDMMLVSSKAFRNSNGSKRNYQVFVAGGRMADVDPPGAGLVFVQTLPNHLNLEFGGKLSKCAVACSFQHGYVELDYTHHGKDRNDAKCLELLLRTMMNNPPSAKSFAASRTNKSVTKIDALGDFWSWFYSKVSPDWLRMCIPPWGESQFAERADRNQGLRYRDKYIHPANTLVCSSEPCLHEDLVERLSELNACDLNAQRFVCKAPSVTAMYEDYPFDGSTGKKQDLLIFYPLTDDRRTYIKVVLSFFALFGVNGFLGEFLKKQRLVLRPELHTAFWPQPFAFIKLSTTTANYDRTLELVKLAQSHFAELTPDKQLKYVRNVAAEVMQNVANPLEVIRDEWLAGKATDFQNSFTKTSLDGLCYLIRVYLSETHMGVIRGLPSAPKGVSIFDAI